MVLGVLMMHTKQGEQHVERQRSTKDQQSGNP